MTPSSDLLAAFASAFDQTHRLITLDIGSDRRWDGRLLPQRVDGQEALSDDGYRYRVECLSPETGLAQSQRHRPVQVPQFVRRQSVNPGVAEGAGGHLPH